MRRTTNGHDEQLRPILLRKSPELLLGSTTAFGRLLPVAKGRNRPKAVDQYLADSDQKVPVGGLSNLPGSQEPKWYSPNSICTITLSTSARFLVRH